MEPFPSFYLLPAFALGGGIRVGGGLGPWVAGIRLPGQLVKWVELRRPKYVFLRIAKSAGPLVLLARDQESP